MIDRPRAKLHKNVAAGNRVTAKPRRGAERLAASSKQASGSATPGPRRKSADQPLTLWTIGHSTRPLNQFVALLRAHRIQQLTDVRTIPRSRHNPQFNQDQLPESLNEAGILYRHMPALGGLRHAHRDSLNTAWRNAGFRGFADYMQTPEFEEALDQLIRLARNRRTAIMCAEAVPWRCHRSLIADALVVHGLNVEDITSETKTHLHALTPWSRVIGKRVTYPAAS